MAPAPSTPSYAEHLDHILALVAGRLGTTRDALDSRQRFQQIGVDSALAVSIAAQLSADLGRQLPATLLWQFPTAEALALHLAEQEALAQPVASHAAGLPRSGGVAVIGLACRFPGAADPAAFWSLLSDGVDAVGEVAPERWDAPGVPADTSLGAESAVRRAGLLSQVDRFDPYAFGISPREAAEMDPQQRLTLELVWEALEDAGIPVDSLRDSPTGVFMGAMWRDYAGLRRGSLRDVSNFTAAGEDDSVISGRVSYQFGLAGPSLTINTACSSSLVAIHLACQSLRAGESSLALAGGVNLILDPRSTVAMDRFGGLSPDGRCKAFDARADGYVRGEGGGVVVLKPLEQALADGDRIYCVVRGSAVNNDGFSNGLTAPNPAAQTRVLRDAWAQAGVAPENVDYVEAHGTGTTLGDPIEAGALGTVFGDGRPTERPLRIGSAKTNIGHLEAAAGIAGLIKVALAVAHRQLPPSLHFASPNPNIPFERLRLAVQTRLEEWPGTGPARAGVSSFGFGGTNCHVAVEAPTATSIEPPVIESSEDELLVLSAHNEAALAGLTRALLAQIEAHPPARLVDLCTSAALDRAHLAYRIAAVCDSPAALKEALRAPADGSSAVQRGRRHGDRPRLAFVFSGQGTPWAGMARHLLAGEPAFRQVVEACDARIRERAAWSLLDVLETGRDLDRTSVAQPAIFAVQTGLVGLLRSWGVNADAVTGHSVGEVAAACAAGVLSLDDATDLVIERGRLMEAEHGHGGMVSVPRSAAGLQPQLEAIGGGLTIGAFNGPDSTVVSGPNDALAAFEAEMQRQAVVTYRLPVDYAFHSAGMEEAAASLERALAGLKARPTAIPIVSTVSGRLEEGSTFDAQHWRENVRRPVLFDAAVETLLDAGITYFLEIGPTPVLGGLLAGALKRHGVDGRALAALRRSEPERRSLLSALGALYVRGWEIDWRSVFPEGRRRVKLPSYPWQRERFWFEAPSPQQAQPAASAERGMAAYYAALARAAEPGYLRFGALPEPLPGFSWLAAWADAERHPDQLRKALAAIDELRDVLFAGVDFSAAQSVLDIGCGYGTDLLLLAERRPHLKLAGYNLSAEQIEIGRRELAARGLADQVALRLGDSALADLGGPFDVALSFQVVHHNRDKRALLANAGRHLRPGGTMLMAEILSNLASPIEHEASSAWFSPAEEWADALAGGGLRIDDCIDASVEVANYLADPEFEQHLAQIAGRYDENALAHLRGPDRLDQLLRRGLAAYLLLRVRRDVTAVREELVAHNRLKLADRTPYAQARRGMPAGYGVELAATRPPQVLPAASGDADVRARVRLTVTDLLRMPAERVEGDRPLGELGLDSMLALELRQRLEHAFAVSLPATLLYNYPTVDELAGFLAGLQPASVAAPAVPASPVPHADKTLPAPPMLQLDTPPRLPARESYSPDEPIAVVGIGCRFPGGVSGPDEFWRFLCEGGDGVRQVPADRWDARALAATNGRQAGRIASPLGGFLDQVDGFDNRFFGVSAREAVRMDPQQRLLLEVAWEALESAGQPPLDLAGSRTGVWIGVMGNDYAQLNYADPEQIDAHSYAGYSFIPNRLSYLLDLRGPSLAVDTACSSSLVAAHLASRSLRSGETDLALAGGVNLILTPALSINYSQWGMLSPEGHCKTFDSAADGFVRGEGCGVVMLKRLSDALRDGDRVWACIRGSAVSQDGRTNVFTAPSGLAQQETMRAALADAGVEPGQVEFVETHGTGTSLGDPIEAEALAHVYGRPEGAARPCLLGAVKTNVGHLEGAAGIAALIKAALCLDRHEVPPNLHLRQLNPHIRLDGTRLALPMERTPWPGSGRSRYAAVSSFGAGGTNAHLVLEEAPPRRRSELQAPQLAAWRLLPISARSGAALRDLCEQMLPALDAAPLDDLCYTAALRRSHLPVRMAIGGRTAHELREALARRLADGADGPQAMERSELRPRRVFVYDGEAEVSLTALDGIRAPQFRAAVDEWRELCRRLGPLSEGVERRLTAQVALTSLLRTWGLGPEAVAGEGTGYVVARWAAGSIDLEAAVTELAGGTGGGAGAAPLLPVLAVAPDSAEDLCIRLVGPVATADEVNILSGGDDSEADLVKALAELYRRGQELDWAAIYPERRPPATLPTYPWQRTRYWVSSSRPSAHMEAPELRRVRAPSPLYSLSLSGSHAALEGHRVGGAPVAPAALWLELARAVEASRGHPLALSDFVLRDRLTLEPGEETETQLAVEGEAQTRLRIYRAPADEDGAWTVLAEGVLEGDVPQPGESIDPAALRAQSRDRIDPDAFYARLSRAGLEYGGEFRAIAELRSLGSEVVARIAPTWDPEAAGGLETAAARWDACLQTLSALLPESSAVLIPFAIERAQIFAAPPASEIWCLARLHAPVEYGGAMAAGDVQVFDAAGVPLAEFTGVRLWLSKPAVESVGLYSPVWRPVETPEPTEAQRKAASWLVLGREGWFREALAAALQRLGAAATAAGAWAESAPDVALNVVYLVGPDAADGSPDATAEDACAELLDVLQAHLRADVPAGRLVLVTRGAYSVDGAHVPDPAQATLCGLIRSAALEHPRAALTAIDLTPNPDEEDAARLARYVCVDQIEREVALRPDGWYSLRLERWQPLEQPRPAFSADGAYLITGGLGALGLHAARWLVERGARRLALLGRSRPSDEAVAAIAELERRGAQVQVLACDVSSPASLEEALGTLKAPLRGVIHAAGVLDDAPVLQLNPERLARGLAPKAAGAWNLHVATRGLDLDLFLLFSSIASLPGSAGQGNYAAANAFLDALAAARRAQGLVATSVNWGPWAGGGMLAGLDDRLQQRWSRQGIDPMDPERALEALDRIVAAGETQVVAVNVAWRRFAEQARFGGKAWPLLDELLPAGPPGPEHRAEPDLLLRLRALPAAGRVAALASHIAALAGEILDPAQRHPAGLSENLFDLGLDSLLALELRNRLQTELGGEINLVSTLAFDRPTPLGMARFVIERWEPGPEISPRSEVSPEEELARRLAEKIAEVRAGR